MPAPPRTLSRYLLALYLLTTFTKLGQQQAWAQQTSSPGSAPGIAGSTEVPPGDADSGSSDTVCMLTFAIDPSRSPSNITGSVTAPLSARIIEAPGTEGLATQGEVHIALYTRTRPCPSSTSALRAALADSSWGFVKGPGDAITGDLTIYPTTVKVAAITDEGAVLAIANVSTVEFFLYSPEPLLGQLLLEGTVAAPTNITLTAGNGSLSSFVAGNLAARLAGYTSLAYSDVLMDIGMGAGMEPGQQVLDGEVSMGINNLTFMWPINPDTIPGNAFINATAEVIGTVFATALLPGAMREEPLAAVAYPNVSRSLQILRANYSMVNSGGQQPAPAAMAAGRDRATPIPRPPAPPPSPPPGTTPPPNTSTAERVVGGQAAPIAAPAPAAASPAAGAAAALGPLPLDRLLLVAMLAGRMAQLRRRL